MTNRLYNPKKNYHEIGGHASRSPGSTPDYLYCSENCCKFACRLKTFVPFLLRSVVPLIVTIVTYKGTIANMLYPESFKIDEVTPRSFKVTGNGTVR